MSVLHRRRPLCVFPYGSPGGGRWEWPQFIDRYHNRFYMVLLTLLCYGTSNTCGLLSAKNSSRRHQSPLFGPLSHHQAPSFRRNMAIYDNHGTSKVAILRADRTRVASFIQ